MRFFIILYIISIQFLAANDDLIQKKLDSLILKMDSGSISNKIAISVDDLTRLQYQSQFIKLNGIVSEVDTRNHVLKTKMDSLSKYIELILQNQKFIYKAKLEKLNEQHEITIKAQELRHKTELELQMSLFKIIIGFASAALSIITFIGYRKIKSTIHKRIKDQIESNHKKETEILVMNLANSAKFVDLIKAELDYREMKDEDEDEDENEDENEDEELE